MRTSRLPAALCALGAIVAVGVLAACGASNDSLNVKEGAALKLGDLTYNVQITRYLNPDDTEDKSYLQGAPSLPTSDYYLAVFMQVSNNGSSTVNLPQDMTVTDTQGNRYHAVNLTNDWAFPFGTQLEPNGSVPTPESAAADGPIEGAMALFLINQSATENRPLELQIPSPDGASGQVELDL
jgi:hypothetical protein